MAMRVTATVFVSLAIAKADQDASYQALRKPKGCSGNNLAHPVARLSHTLSVALAWSRVSCLLGHEATGASPNRTQATEKNCRSPSPSLIVLMRQNLKLREQDGASFSSFPPYPVLKRARAALHGRGAEHCDATASCLVVPVLHRIAGQCGTAAGLECLQVYTCDGCPAHPSTPVADRLSKGYSRCSHFLARDSQGPPSLRSRP